MIRILRFIFILLITKLANGQSELIILDTINISDICVERRHTYPDEIYRFQEYLCSPLEGFTNDTVYFLGSRQFLYLALINSIISSERFKELESCYSVKEITHSDTLDRLKIQCDCGYILWQYSGISNFGIFEREKINTPIIYFLSPASRSIPLKK